MKYKGVKGSQEGMDGIILGTWAIGGSHWGAYDGANAIRAIDAAVDLGITTIDTAPIYGDGHAEELVGKAIQGKRDRMFLATKCGLDIYNRKYERDLSPSYIELDLARSLKRLRTDYVDLYQCHWPDPGTPVEKTMETLVKLRDEGKVRYIGVSNFGVPLLREALGHVPLYSFQAHYSLLERRIEEEALPLCRETGVHVLSYGSLGAGMLTGKYRETPKFSKGDARSFFYRFFKPRYWPKVRRLIDEMEKMATDRGVSIGAIALSWLLAQEGVTSVIVGARSAEQVTENLAHIPTHLNDGEMEILDRLSREVYAE